MSRIGTIYLKINNILNKLGVRFLATIHTFIVLLMISVYLNEFIEPSTSYYFGFISLIFPILVCIHLFITAIWLFSKKIIFLPMLAVTIFLFFPIKKYIHFNNSNKKSEVLKVLTYNIRYANHGKDVNSLEQYIKEKDADIVFLQEIYTRQWRTNETLLTDRNNAIFDLLGISTKFPIVNKQKILLPNNGYACFADIKIYNDTIRCFNVYLEPFKFAELFNPNSNNIDENLKVSYEHITTRLIIGQNKHQEQIKIINKHRKSSPYPTIIAGDFNAVPLSYEYFTLKDSSIDLFEVSGSGLGFTFYDYYYPLRIDYIFADNFFNPINCHVDRDIKYSDHHPVIADLELKNNVHN